MRTAAGAFVLAGALVAGCGQGADIQVAPAAPAVAADESADPVVRKLTKAEWARMVEVGMAGPTCPVKRKNLRRLEINHVNFDGEVKRGAIVVRGDVVESVSRVFTKLFDKRFPIHRMTPVEHFNGSDDRSMAANNTSAYNCRRPSEANSPSMKSPHANGRAIDINPIQNPWLNPRTHVWEPSARYRKRTAGPGKILEGGPVWRLFIREGWIWQDIKTPDYQHFDTGYPSRPLKKRG
ncbi:M15 family metallopeptidase [Sporichthya sp.]|uniref:M15 family metallopeptidase n=1 Tax=Sporichthya sp. TaxID=65475 RepID=UPI0017F180DA|nr:M15 family metallopeptidase [Sporichthya sp.]MBA3744962.1 M15 family metallopeptidase [Sporichthya sp.]